jgi:hypothetical protein
LGRTDAMSKIAGGFPWRALKTAAKKHPAILP